MAEAEDKEELHLCVKTEKFKIIDGRFDTVEEQMGNNQIEILKKLDEGTKEFNRISNKFFKKDVMDKQRNGYIREDSAKIKEIDKRLDDVEAEQRVHRAEVATIKKYQGYIFTAIMSLLFLVVLFVIEFNWKTFILGI